MRTRRYLCALALLFLVALLPLAAQAKTINTGSAVYCAAGDTRIPVFDDFSSKIGTGLTQDDFTFTYRSLSEYLTITEDGQITVRADATLNTQYPFEITYTPKVSGVGRKTTFRLVVQVCAPVNDITASTYDFTIEKGVREELYFYLHDQGSASNLFPREYDESIIEVEEHWSSGQLKMRITGKKTGDTTIKITAYNGKTASVNIHVVDPISKVVFGQSLYTAFQWETIDLKMDYGNGTVNLWPATMKVTRDGVSVDYKRYFPEDAGHFYAVDPGYFDVTIGGKPYESPWPKSAKVIVYQDAICDAIEISTGHVYLERDNMRIGIYDAEGNNVVLPIAVTEGSDIAYIDGPYLRTTGYGNVTLTVTNSDGTTTSRTFEVKANPTKVELNASELTMDIGDVFTFLVSFDQGRLNYTYDIVYDNTEPEYGLNCIRMDGDRLIAQAPGSATITVNAGSLQAECRVTVRDGAGRLTFNLPETLGIGYKCQLSVTDQTGKTYPATFSSYYTNGKCTPEGLLTGVMEGTGIVTAVLEDGRVLSATVEILKIPRWLRHPSLSASVSKQYIQMENVESDVGTIGYMELDVKLEDETIANYSNGRFYPKKVGTTIVTLTALNGGVQTSFTLEILPPDDQLYIGSTTMKIPYGMAAYLPVVTDYQGNTVPVSWEITHHSPGQGNPESVGFMLDKEQNTLACLWPTASCEVTGVTESGQKVKVTAYGFKLPSSISLPEEITIDIQSHAFHQIQITWDEPGCQAGPVLWAAEDDELFTYREYTENKEYNSIVAKKVGTTRFIAMLVDGTYAICTVHVIDSAQAFPGDVNGDGVVDGRDSIRLLRYLAGEGCTIVTQNADINQDGVIDGRDSIRLLKMLL